MNYWERRHGIRTHLTKPDGAQIIARAFQCPHYPEIPQTLKTITGIFT